MTDWMERAVALDANDGMAWTRDRFELPEGVIYLDGNSLGARPRGVAERVAQVLDAEWRDGLIRSWNDAGWFDLPLRVGDRIAPLIGVGAGEVAVGDSTSVNLFKCLAAALHARPDRSVILCEAGNFPTDGYMAQGLTRLVEKAELRWFDDAEDVRAKLGPDVAVVLLSHVHYRSAAVQDMAAVNAAAHAAGALVLWDLSHSTGAVPVDLGGTGADMAVGCTYKYLNGGPGAPAFAWVAPGLAPVSQPLAGWMGHAAPFAFDRDYAPADGARGLMAGTPQVLSLSALDAALEIWEEVDRPALWARSEAMVAFFIDAVLDLCAGHGLALVSPRAAPRGSHVGFDHPEGYAIVQALIARGIIGDFRAPQMMRFGFAPLYLRFADLTAAALALRDVLETRAWDDPRFQARGAVT
ncbi:kynureninase [Mesobacterium pallidum]|uniref:kynureninase n=1 Tax=Mesobacterium pallidum TaxID=2872037 RepID=UPI001EE229A0|nr:kynureninase [Mesobacterium pallidum]